MRAKEKTDIPIKRVSSSLSPLETQNRMLVLQHSNTCISIGCQNPQIYEHLLKPDGLPL
jgi:hypothetical protein